MIGSERPPISGEAKVKTWFVYCMRQQRCNFVVSD